MNRKFVGVAVGLIALGLIGSSGSVEAAKRGELSGLAGNFEGTMVVSGDSLTEPVSGTGKARVKVSKNGKTARIKWDTSVSNQSGDIAIENDFTLTAGNRLKVANLAPGVTTMFDLNGRYRVRNGRVLIRFSHQVGDAKVIVTGSIRVLVESDTRRLVMNYEADLVGGSWNYVYDFVGITR